MNLRELVGAGLLVVLAACAQPGSDLTTPTTHPPTTEAVVTTTTVGVSSTSVPPSTTRVDGGVAIDPNLPAALSGDLIPWADVGEGWYVVLYDSSRANPASGEDIREGPPVLYLVNRDGARYEVAAWEPGQFRTLIDATATSALLAGMGSNPDETVYEVVDLTSGDSSVVHTVGFEERSLGIWWPLVSLTRPDGANVVVHRSDGTIEWLERRARDGTVLAVVYEQTYTEGGRSMAWLYEPEGTSLVVSGEEGIVVVSNEGSVVGEVSSPPETLCEPVRWWNPDTFLAACYGLTAASAPLDEYGQPHTFYGRLWLLETDGSPGTALTEYPAEPTIVVDFGFHDAWPVDDEVFLQWSGDCGSSAVAILNTEGLGEFLQMEGPEGVGHGVAMVDIVDGQMTVYGWDDCAATIGALFTTDLDGRYLSTLVPVVGDARGVIGVRGLATVHP